MADTSQLGEVIDAAFAALGARQRGALPQSFYPANVPQGPQTLAQQVHGFPGTAANLLLNHLGPLGEAGSTLGEMLRTGQFDSRDLPQIAGGVMLGTMAPGGAEAGVAEHAAQNLLTGAAGRRGYDAILRAALKHDVTQIIPSPSFPGMYLHEYDPAIMNWLPAHTQSLDYLQQKAGGTYAQSAKSDISEEALAAALAKNPGASIFDITQSKPASEAPGANPAAAYAGYELHQTSEPGDYFIHAPNGDQIGEVTKQDAGKYKLEMYNGAGKTVESPLSALTHAHDFHTSASSGPLAIDPVSSDYGADLRPLDWTSFTPRGTQSASFEDTALRERARSLGFNVSLPLYKGGQLSDYPETLHVPDKSFERGLFFSDQPSIARSYARYGNPALEYVARAKNPLTIDWPSATGLSEYGDPMHSIIESARKQGADLLHISNIDDIGGKQNQYVVLDPSILRAPNAQFDPTKLHLAKPLAGLAALGLGTGLFLDQNNNPIIMRGE